MKMKIGFSIGENKKENAENIVNAIAPQIVAEEPVRSVVTVRFENGKEYPYYNDEFNLNVGDVVFVDGKLAGQPGRVTEVTTKFKVSLDFYKRVIAKLNLEIHGDFNNFKCMMISENSNLSFEQVSAWFIPPREEEEEFFIGEGYELPIDNFTNCSDIDEDEYDEAVELFFCEGVKFISVKNGVGKAIVKSNKYHIVDFTIENGMIKNLYCDCISPHFCKHLLAVCIALRMMNDMSIINMENDFIAISKNMFYNAVSYNSDKITV